jgi:hypothetical protein
MFQIILKKDRLLSLFIWSFFSFSIIKCFSVFSYSFASTFLYEAILYSILFFIYFFIFKARFRSRLTYLQYTTSSFLFVTGITMFSWSYYKLVMLDNDYFNSNFFIALLISNLVFTSLLFLLTLIKRK